MSAADPDQELLRGLKELAETAFPKRCRNCGRIFENVRDYVAQTGKVAGGGSGLKQSYDDDGGVIVELYRNCPCGSTLMDFFGDRRDHSGQGSARRRRFGELVDYLVSQGVDRPLARSELLLTLRGERSEVLASFLAAKKD